jgi:hypothetical protein
VTARRLTRSDLGVSTVGESVVMVFGTTLLTAALSPDEVDSLILTLSERAGQARLNAAIAKQQGKGRAVK